jgi:hypothetical protein
VVIFKGMIREMTYNREITSDRETTYRLDKDSGVANEGL